MDLAGFRIGDADPLAGIVHERLLAGDMMLAHHWRQPTFEAAQQIAEPTVAIAVRMRRPMLPPQKLQRHAWSLELAMDCRPVRQRGERDGGDHVDATVAARGFPPASRLAAAG